MSPERYQLVKRIFLDACQSDSDHRVAVLDRECGDDMELRTEVESLLRQDATSTDFLEKPAINSAIAWNAPVSTNGHATRPERIGQYRIIDVLGEGGMGMVYLAEQDHPRRPVALKVIRPGIISEPVMRRFEFEATLLGRLHHPGIAQIYEAGTADAGLGPQPFFAMELITGATLRDYATQNNLNTRQRLELLAKVCDAVHHAHQKGIIHRDLKPANILVENEDQEGIEASRHQTKKLDASMPRSPDALSRSQPKVLDFGVARATHSDPAETMRTSAGQLIGTIAYMSPEQVAGDPHDLDTRSDVYSLGVIYYELLSGALPHDFQNRTIAECARIIRDEEITPLSTADRALRGDLEIIVHKALEKDRTRRYQSALQLAEDTRRFLADRTILARPPSSAYQLRKFVKRNRIKVTAMSVAILLLAVSVPTYFVLREQVSVERAKKLQVFDSYVDLLKANLKFPDDGDPLRPHLSDENLLSQAMLWVNQNSREFPLKAAVLLDLIAQNELMWETTYPSARQNSERALAILQPMEQNADVETAVAESLHTLGRAYWHRGQFETAEQHYRQSLAMRERLFGSKNKDTAMTMQHITACLRDEGRLDEALDLALQTLQVRLSFLNESDGDVTISHNSIAAVFEKQQRYEEAAREFQIARDALKQRIGLNADDSRIARANKHIAACCINLAMLAAADSQERNDWLAEAEDLLNQALEMQKKLYKDQNNRFIAETLREYARLCKVRQDWPRAAEFCQRALDIQRDKLGHDHVETIETQQLRDEIQQAQSMSTRS